MARDPGKVSALTNAAVDLEALREDGWSELVGIVTELTGNILIVLDAQVLSLLKLIAPGGNLSPIMEHGVSELQTLNWNYVNATSVDHVVYLVRPSFLSMRQIAHQVHHAARLRPDIKFHLRFVPKRSFICEKVLKDEGVFADLSIGDFSIDLVPIDDDLLSMQQEDAFKACYIEEDPTPLHDIARTIFKLQRLFGVIPKVRAKGTMSKAIVDMLTRFRREEGDDLSYEEPEIDTLILLDRNVDFVTPLVTPLTFEALVDETFGIDCASIEIDASVVTAEADVDPDADKVRLPLNSNDKLYCEIRDLNIASVKPLLQSKARDIQALADNRHQLRDSRMAEIKKYVKRISGVTAEKQSLYQFVNLTEKVQRVTSTEEFHEQWQIERAILVEERTREVFERIDTAIGKREPLSMVLQLLCLQCQVENGFKPKIHDHYRREIVQAYGFQHLFTLYNLERLGLLKHREGSAWGSGNWGSIRSAFHLIDEDPRLEDPESMAYVTSGYAPLSTRLVETCLSPGWGSMLDSLNLLPGPTTILRQRPPGAEASGEGVEGGRGGAGAGAAPPEAEPDRRRKVVLVFFVGGVTYVEIAALRFLTDKMPYDFIIATTNVVNGKSLVASMEDKLDDEMESAGLGGAAGAGGGGSYSDSDDDRKS